MQAANHEMSTFALVSVSAHVAGAPPWSALVLGLLGAHVSDWPDIDAERSRIISMLWWAPFLPGALQAFSAIVWEACATEADRRNTAQGWGPRFRVHRGFWHSLWGALLTGLVWYALLTYGLLLAPAGVRNLLTDFWALGYPTEVVISATMVVGMLGHVLGDSCTDFGTAPLAPVWKWNGHRYVKMGLWEPLRFKVGKPVELGLITPLCTAFATWSAVGIWTGLESGWALYAGLGAFAFALLGVIIGKRKRKKLLGV